jgi:hypothetical protein
MERKLQLNIGANTGTISGDLSDLSLDEMLKLAEVRKGHAEASIIESDVADRVQDRGQRQEYANKIFYLVAIFVISVLLIVVNSRRLGLSDAVIITLVTTSMTTVIGIFVFVAKYLFRTDGKV